jgi:hypothetical protein
MAKQTQESLKDFDCVIHDGTNYPSFSKLVNDCIVKAKTETVIIASDKVRPSSNDIKKMLFLLKKGFGFVAMHNFYFFGMNKNLIRKIGFFDERFVGGGYEDVDWGRRLLEHDIALYISIETPVEHSNIKSSWNYEKAYQFYTQKWEQSPTRWKRLMDDEKYDYDIGQEKETYKWMTFKNSLMPKTSIPSHHQLKFFNDKPIDLSGIQCSSIL